ncbi:MAG: ABC transporter substrate-binding protein [Flavobacteriales bacterium]
MKQLKTILSIRVFRFFAGCIENRKNVVLDTFSFRKNSNGHFFIFILLVFFGCSEPAKEIDDSSTLTNVKLNYAQGFTIENGSDFKVLTLKSAWKGESTLYQYVLYKNEKPTGFDDAVFIKTPIKSIVCFSLTHVAFIDKLNELNSIKALSGCDYVSNEKVLENIKNQQIKEVGNNQLINYELLVELNPEIVMTFGIDASSSTKIDKLKKLGLNVVLNSEYMENHPLGKAEWIKFVAAFYDKDSLAEVIYNDIEVKYNNLVELTKTVSNKPTVFVGMPWNGAWYLAGGKSFQAQLFTDAGADYLWKQNEETSSFVVDKEVIIEKAINADYWINLNAYNSIKEVTDVDAKLNNFKSVKEGKVYNNNKKLNTTNGNDYWESGVINPEVVLADLIKIFHPNLLEHELEYYKRLE